MKLPSTNDSLSASTMTTTSFLFGRIDSFFFRIFYCIMKQFSYFDIWNRGSQGLGVLKEADIIFIIPCFNDVSGQKHTFEHSE